MMEIILITNVMLLCYVMNTNMNVYVEYGEGEEIQRTMRAVLVHVLKYRG